MGMDLFQAALARYQSRPSLENTFEALRKRRVDRYNESEGDLTGYDCKECKNRGDFLIISGDGYEMVKSCKCMAIRRNLRLIKQSGLSQTLEFYTFEAYKDTEPWQTEVKDICKDYLHDYSGKWLFIGGQVGCGKTHLCTAVVGEFLKMGMPSKYMLWRDESVKLKSVVNSEEEYAKKISDLKEIRVLYIDDFFKTERGKTPTTADINLAFEILNYRYINPELITIISSELSVDELLDIDEATGSRIYQRTKGHCKNIRRDKAKNYRTR